MAPEQVIAFCRDLAPHLVMVGIQSFAGVAVALLNMQFEKVLNKGQLA